MFTNKLICTIACFILAVFTALPLRAQNVSVQPLITNLDNPTSIAHAGDGTGRLFITEQDGRILVYDGTQILAAPFLDIMTEVDDAGSEEGLLGLAFHPEFASNPDKKFFYVNYTTDSSQTVVERYTVSADGNSVVANSGEIILSFNQPAGNHNGGYLAFGSDDMLYISSGDGGGSPGNRAQETTNLLGKILRIGVDNDSCPNEIGENYCIPSTNPFNNEIWVIGLRNPWKFSFDDSGNMFIGDVGQRTIEEINYQPLESTGGENYGWQCFEGNNIFDNRCSAITHTQPITFYTHSSGNCSVTGGFRYEAGEIPLLVNDYLYGDFCSGRIWRATENSPGNWSSALLLDTSINIASFGEDENGEIYLLDNPFTGNGGLYRLVNDDPPPPPPPGGSGAYIETDGQVVMEAENFDENNPGTTDDWFLSTSQGGFSGTGYMESGPNIPKNTINTGYAANSPELMYLVNFSTTGTYYVWTRACGPSVTDDSIHMGIDGNENNTANRKRTGNTCNAFQWQRDRMSSAPDATINVNSPGVHEINLWMREDGSRVDKVLLTTDSGFTPTGSGPAESVRDGDPPPDPEGTNAGECTDGIDNDNDGPIDCNDSGCFDDPACIVPDPEGTNPGECTDGIDNDNDGPIDCNDSGCFDDPACTGGSTGPFMESGGLLVMEAENFDQNNSGTTDDWFLSISQGGFSGAGYMESGPNIPKNTINTGYAANSPELMYLVNFSTTGTYYVWTRACGPSVTDDSIHMGIDGNENNTANRKRTGNTCNAFQWQRDRMSSAPDATINVNSPGVHEINLWMREDGSRVDKVLLTTDSGFNPTGAGPAESIRGIVDDVIINN